MSRKRRARHLEDELRVRPAVPPLDAAREAELERLTVEELEAEAVRLSRKALDHHAGVTLSHEERGNLWPTAMTVPALRATLSEEERRLLHVDLPNVERGREIARPRPPAGLSRDELRRWYFLIGRVAHLPETDTVELEELEALHAAQRGR